MSPVVGNYSDIVRPCAGSNPGGICASSLDYPSPRIEWNSEVAGVCTACVKHVLIKSHVCFSVEKTTPPAMKNEPLLKVKVT